MESNITKISKLPIYLALIAVATQFLLLASLHWLSPEFDPSWRVISEYANGSYGWVLSLMFAAGAVSAWALAFAIWSQIKTKSGKVGLWFLLAVGAGPGMAAVFDINHPLHNMAGFVGIVSLAVAALLISRSLARTQKWSNAKKPLMCTAHLVWISLILFFITTALLGITYTQAGGEMPPNGQALPIEATLPEGTIAINGWFNRLIILSGGLWVATAAWQAVRMRSTK